MNQISTEMNANKVYFDEINLFRGFCIFTIVWGHMVGMIWSFSKVYYQTEWEVFNRIYACLIQGNTTFFVFISGFLFYKVFYIRGFNYKKFILGKFKKVFMPWLIITTIFACFRLYSGHGWGGILLFINVIYIGHFGIYRL